MLWWPWRVRLHCLSENTEKSWIQLKSTILFFSLRRQCKLYQHQINQGVGEWRVKRRKLICIFIILLKVSSANGIYVLAVCLWVPVCVCVVLGKSLQFIGAFIWTAFILSDIDLIFGMAFYQTERWDSVSLYVMSFHLAKIWHTVSLLHVFPSNYLKDDTGVILWSQHDYNFPTLAPENMLDWQAWL